MKHYSDTELDGLLAGITPGEWWANIHAEVFSGPDVSHDSVAECVRDEDAKFFAAAPALVRQLWSERDAAVERMDEYRNVLVNCKWAIKCSKEYGAACVHCDVVELLESVELPSQKGNVDG